MKAVVIALSALVIGIGGAFAQDAADGRFMYQGGELDFHASDLLGANVYVSQMDVAPATTVDGVPDDWENVANVDDLVLRQDGTIGGVIVDVGGFLGIGARSVMVSMDELQIVREHDSDAIFVVFTATREELEMAPEYDRDWRTRDAAAGAPADPAAPADTTTQPPVDDQGRMVGVPEERLEGFEPIEFTALTADELRGATVYDRMNERVAGISDLVLSDDGSEVTAVLIDVGGFLGLFARTVMVDIEQLEIQVDPQRADVRVYLNMTREELEALPEYDQ